MLNPLWLVHSENAICDAFHRRFDGLRSVRVIRGTFEDLEPHDAFVTAGNAFGIMIRARPHEAQGGRRGAKHGGKGQTAFSRDFRSRVYA